MPEINNNEDNGTMRTPTEKLPQIPEMNTIIETRQVYNDLLAAQMELKIRNEELTHAKRELERSREKYFQLFNNAPVGYVTVDETGKITEVNQTMANMLMIDKAEIKGKNVEVFIDPAGPTFNREPGSGMGVVSPKVQEVMFVRRGDGPFWVRVEIACESDSQYSVMVSDISEQKAIDLLLKKNEEKYRTLVENQNEFVVKVDSAGIILYASPSYCNLFGIPEHQLLGTSFVPLIHPDDVELTGSAMLDLNRPPYTCYVEQRARTTDGWRWLAWSDRAIFDETGQIQYIIGVGRDVTDRRVTEEKLRTREEQFRSMLELLPEMVVVHQNGTVVFVNKLISHVSGYANEEIVGNDLLNFVAAKDRDNVVNNLTRKLKGEDVGEYEIELYTKAGQSRHVIVRTAEIIFNSKPSTILVLADVTGIKTTTALLAESEERFRVISEYSHNAICIIGKTGQIEWVNEKMVDMSHYSVPEILGAGSFASFLAPESVEFVLDNFMKMVNGEPYVHHYRFKIIRKDGAIRICEKHMNHFTDRHGELKLIVSMIDITDQLAAESRLVESEARYGALFRENKSVMLLLDPESGRIVDANPAACRFYGYEQDELKTMNIADFHVTSPEVLREELGKSMHEDIHHFFYQHVLRDGTLKYIEAFSGPINFGEETLVYAIVHDITNRIRAERDLHERIKELNGIYKLSQLIESRGLKAEELMLKTLNIIAGSFKYPGDTVVSIVIRGQSVSHDNFRMTPWHMESGIRVNGHSAGRITVCYLEEKEAEFEGPFFREERLLLEEMAKRISRFLERRDALNQLIKAKEMAEAGDRLKSAFIQNISHEVRTPLNGILGFGSLLGQPDITEEEKQQFITLLKLSCDRLLGTISDYMDISLISSGNLSPQVTHVKIKQEMANIFDHFDSYFRSKNINFSLIIPELFEDLHFETDLILFRKMMHHVIGNSLKFTHKGSVVIETKVSQRTLTFIVKDTGIGISGEAMNRIFNLFEQEESTRTRKYEGSGLGLPIIKGILKSLGGRIHIDSVKGKGTSVKITFPFSLKREMENQPGFFIRGRTKPPMILIVEDDTTNKFLLEKILASCTSGIISASDGRQAVKLCSSNPGIDLVLMDIKMPVLDGVEATREIRQMRPELPIIAITAYATSEEMERALQAGCTDYIYKPVTKQDLYAKIKQVLEG